MSTIRPITLDSDVFKKLKDDMTEVINLTLGQMSETESEEGAISVSLKIKTVKMPITNESKYREALQPIFEHKVKSSVQFKCEKTGELQGQYELYYDSDTGKWAIKDLPNQMSMFEEIEHDSEDDAEDEDTDE